MEHGNLYYVVRDLLLQLPSLLTMAGCIVFALVRWKKFPRVSLAIVASLGFLIVHVVVFAFVFPILPEWLTPSTDIRTRQMVINILAFIYNSSLAIGLAILLVAVFMQRPARASSGGSS
jgi:hypothetical protein